MTQAQRNPRLAGVDGADEIVPTWREVANRQVSSPERISEILAGVREMLGQRSAKRREQERENLPEESFEGRRQAAMRALEAAYPEIRQSQNGEIH
jgi:hypothetical protein